MSKLARINQATGEVVNIIMPYAPPQGFIEVQIADESPVAIGWTYANGTFAPPPAQPEEATQEP